MFNQNRIKVLEKQVKVLQQHIKSMMEIFGLCGYIDLFISDDDTNLQIVSSYFKRLDKKKLPVKSEDFNLLLDYLKLKIQPEKIDTVITPKKIIKN